MKKLFIILFPIIILTTTLYAQYGDLKIICSPNIKVFIDDNYVGTTKSQENGIYISDVKAGMRKIRLEKEGYYSQSYDINILEKELIELEIEFSQKPISISEGEKPVTKHKIKLEQKFGSLYINTKPMECTINVAGITKHKQGGWIKLNDIPTGRHLVVLERGGEKLKLYVTVEEDICKEVYADFVDKTIIDKLEQLRIEVGVYKKINLRSERKIFDNRKQVRSYLLESDFKPDPKYPRKSDLHFLSKPFQSEFKDFDYCGIQYVVDLRTGLMWRVGSYSYRTQAKELNTRHANFTDWRLATIDELFSFITPPINSYYSSGDVPFDPTVNNSDELRKTLSYSEKNKNMILSLDKLKNSNPGFPPVYIAYQLGTGVLAPKSDYNLNQKYYVKWFVRNIKSK